MPNQYEQFALEKYGEINGLKLCRSEVQKPPKYFFYNPDKPNTFADVTINHEFCHALIKGLGDLEFQGYLVELNIILKAQGIWPTEQATHTATTDQLLEAFYQALNG